MMTHWRTLATSFGIAAAYVTTAGVILYVALAGIGWRSTPFWAVVAVYYFNLAVVLIFPLPTDFGISELTGVGAFLLVGVNTNAAIGALLLNRGFAIVFPVLLAAVTLVFVRDELKKALRNRSARLRGQKEQEPEPNRDDSADASTASASEPPRSSQSSASTAPIAESRSDKDSAALPSEEWHPWRYGEEGEEAEGAG